MTNIMASKSHHTPGSNFIFYRKTIISYHIRLIRPTNLTNIHNEPLKHSSLPKEEPQQRSTQERAHEDNNGKSCNTQTITR